MTDPPGLSNGGLVTVTGGKWTTYRAMAEDVLDKCFAAGLLPKKPGGVTADLPLAGAPAGASPASIHEAPGPHLYGSESALLESLPGARREIGLGLTEAMVRFAARYEYARTAEDVLARRHRMLFLDARQAAAVAADVGAVLLQETGRDADAAALRELAGRYVQMPA